MNAPLRTLSEAAVAAGVRATIGAHTQAQDAGRTDDIVTLYTEDAVLEVPGMDDVVGREALRTTFAGWAPQGPQRHMVANTVVTSFDDQEATAISDVVFLTPGETGWAVRLVGRYHDTLRLDGGTWRFARRSTVYS